jgi:hypothetical protein
VKFFLVLASPLQVLALIFDWRGNLGPKLRKSFENYRSKNSNPIFKKEKRLLRNISPGPFVLKLKISAQKFNARFENFLLANLFPIRQLIQNGQVHFQWTQFQNALRVSI